MLVVSLILGLISYCLNLNSITHYNTAPLVSNVSFAYDSFRLPSSVLPSKYKISIIPNWFNTSNDGAVEYFKGEVIINLRVNERTDFIVLNAKDLTINTASLIKIDHLNSDSQIEIQSINYDNNRLEMIYLSLEETLEIDTNLILNLTYFSKIGLNRVGFYRSLYKNSNQEKSYTLATQFSPHHARRAFPCFDEPNFKASFHISLTRLKHLKSLSNMPLKESRLISKPLDRENNHAGLELIQDIFEPSLVMSTYLVAFIIHDYASIHAKTNSGVKISLSVPPELISKAQFPLDLAVKGLEFYENFFGIKYPLTKMDLVGVADFYFGAMENWGLITFRLPTLIYTPELSTHALKQLISINLLHELAHQWFGNLVTMEWWSDLWLKEGFATYLSYLSLDALYPEWEVFQQFPSRLMPTAMTLDGKASSHPISSEINNPNEIQSTFDAIAYSKSPLIVASLDGTVLEHDIFKKGLQNYLTKFAYKNCDSNDLWQSFQNAYDETSNNSSSPKPKIDVSDFMSSWINQKGFPVINISKLLDSSLSAEAVTTGRITLSQTKSSLMFPKINTKSIEGNKYEVWQIAVKFLYGDRHNENVDTMWFKSLSANKSLEVQNEEELWVKANHKYSGFYLVEYDKKLREAIVAKMKHNISAFKPIDRLQIFDNLKQLYSFGYVEVVDVLNYLINTSIQTSNLGKDAIIKETDTSTLISIATFLNDVSSQAKHLSQQTENRWKQFILKNFLVPLLPKYGWSANVFYLDTLLKSILNEMAMTFDHAPTIEIALSQYAAWLKVPKINQTIVIKTSPDLVYDTLLAAINHGTDDDWNIVWKAYLDISIPTLKDTLFYSLGTSKNIDLLTRYLNLSIGTGDQIRQQDIFSIFAMVSKSSVPGASELAWNFLINNWEILKTKLGGDASSLNSLVNTVATTFDDSCHLAKYQAYASLHLNTIPKHLILQTIETIHINIGLIEMNAEHLEKWIINHCS